MLIHCTQCHRSYDVDDSKAAAIAYASCSCKAVLALHPAKRGVTQIGRYILVNQIAVGGMGEIWFALQQGSDGFEKEVVVKRLLPSYAADKEITAMLIKEAKVSSYLKHPNIVEVYDLVRLQGSYLIVMEYVPGITVRDLVNACCRAEVLPPWQLSVYIVLQLLRGLGYAHRLPQRDNSFATFIHRDISPQNLLICPDATVKVTDFGIAKAINEASNTAPGLIRGKASYLTPERVRGGDVNEMSDLFPAAIVLYEMWTLTSLFRADNHEGTLRKLFEAHVPALTAYRDDISPDLDAVMRKALHRRVSERYASARDFEAALIYACTPTTTEQLQDVSGEFLAQHSDFFASLSGHKAGPSDVVASSSTSASASMMTSTSPAANPSAPGKIPRVDTLLQMSGAPEQGAPPAWGLQRVPWWWQVVAALALFGLGFSTAAWMDRRQRSVHFEGAAP